MSAEDAIGRTRDLWDRARGILATGTWTPSQGIFEHSSGHFPLMVGRAEGCTLWDTAGQRFCDWIMGWGPVILGYRDSRVEEAIRAQIPEGPLFSLLHPLEIEVAEKLRELVPCAERVAFGKNGSDVLAAAVRIARAITGREGILVHGYHGFHDWYMASQPACAGIPGPMRQLVRFLPYNDLEGVKDLFKRYGDRIAAVVMEPVNTEMPAPGFLEGIRALTASYGALLVFDEVITAFRIARGGAQEAFGVIPDLACVGKAIANGMPLSALCGAARVMEVLGRVGYGLTYRGETLSLAAARACLAIHAAEPVAEKLASTGTRVRAAFASSAARHEVAAALIGPPCRMTFRFDSAGQATPTALLSLFVQECLRRGVLTNGNLLPSLAHDETAINETAGVFDQALAVVKRAIGTGGVYMALEAPVLRVFNEDSRVVTGMAGAAS